MECRVDRLWRSTRSLLRTQCACKNQQHALGPQHKTIQRRELPDHMFKVRPQTPHTHLQLAATSKIKEFPSKEWMQQLKCSKRFLQEKITSDTTFAMNPTQGRWLLVYKKSSYFWYNNNVVSRTICMNLIESFFYDCNSAQLTNQLPILVTATWTWLMYSVLYQPTRIIKINDKKKKIQPKFQEKERSSKARCKKE